MVEKRPNLPSHETGLTVRSEVRKLRKNAPGYFLSLIENGVLENITSIRDIPSQSMVALGGLASACYFYENNGKAEVVKFGTLSTEAEEMALKAWKAQGASVPDVKSSGYVPGVEDRTKYIVLEGITTSEGERAPIGEDFIARFPDKTEQLGRIMGVELAHMHRAETALPFGAFADTKGSTASTAAEYYGAEIRSGQGALKASGMTDAQLDDLYNNVQMIHFPEKGVFVHGDYGPHNVLVNSSEPLSIKVFDPAPRIADGYWDIARLKNQVELLAGLVTSSPEDSELLDEYHQRKTYTDTLINSYTQTTGESLDPQRLLANQIVTELRSIQRQVNQQPHILAETGKDTNLDPKNLKKKQLLVQRVNAFLIA